jgi:hypothetical protein
MDAIALNNKAVVLMRQGNLQVTSHFIAALNKLHRVDQHEDVDVDVDLDDKMSPTFLSVRSVPLEDSLFNTSSYQAHHGFSLFDRFLLIDDAELALASSLEVKNCASAVILFNMGLALQLQGIQNMCPLQTSFLNALKFYKKATQILQRCTDSDDEVNCLVYLAVANNMGHIYSHFCEASNSQRCLEWLQAILEAVKDSEVYILGEDYHPFHMNVLILHGQDIVAAAAA